MSFRRTVTNMAGNAAARRAAPAIASRGVRQFLSKAIDGFPGFPGARDVGRKYLARTHDVDRAVKGVIEQHVRLAGAQGFVTNIGGVVTLAAAIPANLAGLALLQVRMVAAIAHLRGYEVADNRVRAAALMTLLGEDGVLDALKGKEVLGTPHDVAVGIGEIDPTVLESITTHVTQALVTRVGGKFATLAIAKGVPVISGAVSAGVDAFGTYSVGRYADREFPPHIMIERA
jgi:phage antirepressor YoqD-like protein